MHLTTNLITQLIERCFLDCSHHFMRSKKLFRNLAKNLAKKLSYGGRLNSRRSKGTHFFTSELSHMGEDVTNLKLKVQLDLAIAYYENLVFEARCTFDLDV